MNLQVEVLDEWLAGFLAQPSIELLDMGSPYMDMKLLLSRYPRLKRRFRRFKHSVLSRPQKSEKLKYGLHVTRLFAEDFMRDQDILGIFGSEHSYELGDLERSHWNDMQRHAVQIQRDLDQIDESVGVDAEAKTNSNETEPTSNRKLLHPTIRC
jgi:hypothetical protein